MDPARETRQCSLCNETKSLDDFYPQKSLRNRCKACHYRVKQEWRVANRERVNAQARAARAANPDRIRSTRRQWCAKNAEKHRANTKRWRDANPHAVTAQQATRRAGIRTACPTWVDRGLITAIYAEARALSKNTGIEHHVDHVIPLRHPAVCGLHVPWNLRVLPWDQNLAKSNHFDPVENLNDH